MGYIYKITNQINGKMYIGKTEHINPYDRWKEHIRDRKRRRCEKRPLYSAMNKYGVENFMFEVIDSADDGQTLCDKEIEYIEKYRTYTGFKDCNGYNNTLGGEGKSYIKLDESEVIRIHKENDYVSGRTAKIFGVERDTIQKILSKHGVRWLSNLEITEMEFLRKYGGVVQLDFNSTFIIDMYNTPRYVLERNPEYRYKTLKYSLNPNHPTHHAYGYTWYRLNELPEEYKPLLEEYCINSDNLEMDDTMLDY